MANKKKFIKDIRDTLNSLIVDFEKKYGKKIGPVSRDQSFRIRIMMDLPDDCDWDTFNDEITIPLKNYFKKLNWTVSTNSEPGVGFWIELT